MEDLKRILGSLLKEAQRAADVVEPWHSFWYHRPHLNFPPRSIRHFSDYDGSDRLCLACTQTNLPPREQKELVRSWCEHLPKMARVRFLWFQSRVTQELFDAACMMPGLEGLYIKWSGVTSAASISNLSQLKYLHIGSSPSLAPLEALGGLPLTWLELHNIKASADLSFLGGLPELKGLAVTGDMNSIKTITLDTLAPLRALKKLEWLQLATVKVQDGSLSPIADLPSLRYLHLSNRFPLKEFAQLAGRLPHVSSAALRAVGEPVSWRSCKQCGKKTMVMLTGKGATMLCTACDSQAIQKHEEAFFRIARTQTPAA
jgi:hypothetical protein